MQRVNKGTIWMTLFPFNWILKPRRNKPQETRRERRKTLESMYLALEVVCSNQTNSVRFICRGPRPKKNWKRIGKNEKYGIKGKKKGWKANDAASAANFSQFGGNKQKFGGNKAKKQVGY
jgi:hypothetical protein